MSDEYVILVDGNDNPIGTEEKVKCHLPDGKLHRAFTALLFDKNGRLVLTRRAKEKMLWPKTGMGHLQVIHENLNHMFHQEKEECQKN